LVPEPLPGGHVDRLVEKVQDRGIVAVGTAQPGFIARDAVAAKIDDRAIQFGRALAVIRFLAQEVVAAGPACDERRDVLRRPLDARDQGSGFRCVSGNDHGQGKCKAEHRGLTRPSAISRAS
jgi:hypothetical protein